MCHVTFCGLSRHPKRVDPWGETGHRGGITHLASERLRRWKKMIRNKGWMDGWNPENLRQTAQSQILKKSLLIGSVYNCVCLRQGSANQFPVYVPSRITSYHPPQKKSSVWRCPHDLVKTNINFIVHSSCEADQTSLWICSTVRNLIWTEMWKGQKVSTVSRWWKETMCQMKSILFLILTFQ